jgi:Flp pilus assembly protein CpaB
MRRPRIAGRRGGAWLLAAGLIGLVAAVVTVRAAGQADASRAIVVAQEPLPAGLLIDEVVAATALAAVPGVAAGELRGVFSDPVELVGRRVAVPVGAGEPVSDAALGGADGTVPAPLRIGERAVAVPLSAAGGPAAGLAAGSRVDVVASTGEGPAGTSALVVADAEVLAVAGSAEDDLAAGSGEALLRVSSPQALRVTAALNFAREVRLLVRPLDEVGPPAGPRSVDAP